MVGISGFRDRVIDVVEKGGYNVAVFSWPNWEKYFDRYVGLEFMDKDGNVVSLRPEFQWQWKENYPELVVEDVLNGDVLDRDKLYGDLVYRGVNKWLFVRYLLVRYKKLVAEWRNEAYDKWAGFREVLDVSKPVRYSLSPDDWGKINYYVGYWRGYFDAMRRVRADLKTLAMTPRFVVWNGDRPGFVVDKKISDGWLKLVKNLYDVRFWR